MATSNMREYTLSVNSYNRPLILEKEDAICAKLIEIILLEKGIYLTRPDMGLGIVSRYRFSAADELETFKADLNSQIETYLPELIVTEIDVTMTDKIIKIVIIIDNVVYTLTFNNDTKTLQSL